MRKYSLLLGMCIVSGVAAAQESASTPIAEVGLNYSYVHLSSTESASPSQNGGSGYLEYNLNSVVGLVADLGGYANGSGSTFAYLFGPRFNWRKSRLVPYVQFLFGGADTGLNGSLASTARNGFATAAGGGIDIAVTKHIALKPIQLEYVTVRPSSNSFQNDLRYSAGVVYRFGAK